MHIGVAEIRTVLSSPHREKGSLCLSYVVFNFKYLLQNSWGDVGDIVAYAYDTCFLVL